MIEVRLKISCVVVLMSSLWIVIKKKHLNRVLGEDHIEGEMKGSCPSTKNWWSGVRVVAGNLAVSPLRYM